MAGFVKLATTNDIPSGEARAFEQSGRRIAVYRIGDTFYATTDVCTHAYAELSEGFLDTEECTIECPLHGSHFDLRSGAALSLPAYEPIETYPVRVDGSDVLVELPD